MIVAVSDRSRQTHVRHPEDPGVERPGEHERLELEQPVDQPQSSQDYLEMATTQASRRRDGLGEKARRRTTWLVTHLDHAESSLFVVTPVVTAGIPMFEADVLVFGADRFRPGNGVQICLESLLFVGSLRFQDA